MTTPNAFTPVTQLTLPVSLGGDLLVDFMNRVPGSDPAEYVDYPDTTTVSLVIGKTTATTTAITVDAVISGHHAVCRLPSAQADLVKTNTVWRCVITLLDPDLGDPVPVVAVNGVVVRHDGN